MRPEIAPAVKFTYEDFLNFPDDGKRHEKVTIMKQGAGYIAKRENEPSFYELDAKAVEELQKTASEVKEFQPPKPETKKK